MHSGYLFTSLMVCNFITSCLYGMEPGALTPEQVVIIIRKSDNPALDPLKVGIQEFADHIVQPQEVRNKRKPDDDAAPAPAHLLNTPETPTPANSPTKLRSSRRIRRPAPVRVDTGVGIGNLNLYDFAEITPPNQPVEKETITLEKEARKIEQCIARLEALSTQLLENQETITAPEKKAIEYINAKSRQARAPRAATAAAIGAAAGSLAWVAHINPFKVYKDCCSDTKFTGFEVPALLTALKALIGPVIALIGIGVAWYNFKKWIADPYKQETEKIRKELIEQFTNHKRHMNEAITRTQLQSQEIHDELKQTHEAIHKTINEQLARSESVNREQLEYTLKTITTREEGLKKQVAEFTTTAAADLLKLSDNVKDLQESRDEMRTKTQQAITQQQDILKLVGKIKKNEEELIKVLKTKPLVSSPRIIPIIPPLSSPQSAPAGGKGSESLVAPPPSPQLPRSPQSAQELGTKNPKRSILAQIRGKSSAQVSPLPLLHLAGSEAESKRTAAGNSPAAALAING